MFGFSNIQFPNKLLLEEFIVGPFLNNFHCTFLIDFNRTFRCLALCYQWEVFDLLDVTPNQHLCVGSSMFMQALREDGFERKSSEQILLRGVCYSVTG